MSLFTASGLIKQFRGLRATDHVSIAVESGEVHALIGPNGAGKSTLVNLISGMLPADAGQITLDGVELTGLPPHKRVRAGLSRCFQVTNLFRKASVRDNLRTAVQAHRGSSFRLFGTRNAEMEINAEAESIAAQVGLSHTLDHIAGSLPHGAQRQLDIALALAARPRLLLLDEPMAGMGPDESARVVELIDELRKHMAILLIEHDMDAVFKLADRISVLVYGKVLASGNVDSIRANPDVQAVYLGTGEPT
jgi:branched-chain amino acid transport system ATP-binding protein